MRGDCAGAGEVLGVDDEGGDVAECECARSMFHSGLFFGSLFLRSAPKRSRDGNGSRYIGSNLSPDISALINKKNYSFILELSK
jgi:hypothetical protein